MNPTIMLILQKNSADIEAIVNKIGACSVAAIRRKYGVSEINVPTRPRSGGQLAELSFEPGVRLRKRCRILEERANRFSPL